MASSTRQGLTAALRGLSRRVHSGKRPTLEQQFQSLRVSPSLARGAGSRYLSTDIDSDQPDSLEEVSFTAAPEIDFAALEKPTAGFRFVRYARPLPATPSYFSRTAQFNDLYLALERLARKYAHLPVIAAADAERVSWKNLADLRLSFAEPIRATEYAQCLILVKRLHLIHPDLKPDEVTDALGDFKRDVQAFHNVPAPIPLDKFGRALGVGKRKASTARAFVVEGDGQVLVNGKTLVEYFGRVHDRESAVWALHSTDRVDKYNVWARVEGGGTTGQAEALTLAIAKALMAHEPALKPALRRAGCVTRDPRTVERKKHGRVKARKGPTWVKR